MNSLGKRVFLSVSFAFCAAVIAGCASPPPPPPAAAPPLPERTCETLEKTDVLGDARAEGQVTRETTLTRCVTQ